MAKNKEEKTNVMRTLEQKKIPYTAFPMTPTALLTACRWRPLWDRSRRRYSKRW